MKYLKIYEDGRYIVMELTENSQKASVKLTQWPDADVFVNTEKLLKVKLKRASATLKA